MLMNTIERLLRSQSKAALWIRIIALCNVAFALLLIFAVEFEPDRYYIVKDEFLFTDWLLVCGGAILVAIIAFGFATVIDAAYLYVKEHAPVEEEY